MARFYGEIQGNRGEATRMGHQDFRAHVRGWDFGIKVYCNFDKARGVEVYEVWTTGGSNNPRADKMILREEV